MLFDHGNCRSLSEALVWAQEARRAGLIGSYPSACVVLEKYAVELHCALKELVRLKDLKTQIGANNTDAEDEYERRKPEAWARAREILKA